VLDEWQGKGVGSLLLRRMREIARARGLAGFSADLFADNEPMLRVFQKSGMKLAVTTRGNVLSLTARFVDGDDAAPPSVHAFP